MPSAKEHHIIMDSSRLFPSGYDAKHAKVSEDSMEGSQDGDSFIKTVRDRLWPAKSSTECNTRRALWSL